MIPPGWTPYRRPEDEELVGYLHQDEGGTTALSLTGYPLGGPGTRQEAEALLRRRGLAVLAEPWWLAEEGGPGFRVQVLSAQPGAVTVARADYGFVSHDSERRSLKVPVPGLRPLAG